MKILKTRNRGSPRKVPNDHAALVQTMFGLTLNNRFNTGLVVKAILTVYPLSSKQKVRKFLVTPLSDEEIFLEPYHVPLSEVLNNVRDIKLLSEADYDRIRKARAERKSRRNRESIASRKERTEARTSIVTDLEENFDRLFFKAMKQNGFIKNIKNKNKNKKTTTVSPPLQNSDGKIKILPGIKQGEIYTEAMFDFMDPDYKIEKKELAYFTNTWLTTGMFMAFTFYKYVEAMKSEKNVAWMESRVQEIEEQTGREVTFAERSQLLHEMSLNQIRETIPTWCYYRMAETGFGELISTSYAQDITRDLFQTVHKGFECFSNFSGLQNPFSSFSKDNPIATESMSDFFDFPVPVWGIKKWRDFIFRDIAGDYGLFGSARFYGFVLPAFTLYNYYTFKPTGPDGSFTYEDNKKVILKVFVRGAIFTLLSGWLQGFFRHGTGRYYVERMKDLLISHNEHVYIQRRKGENRGISYLIDKFFGLFLKNDIVTEALSDRIKEITSMWSVILSSELVCLIRDVLLFMVGQKVFSKDISKDIIKKLGPPKKMDLLGSITYILETVTRVVQFGEDCEANGLRAALQRESDPSGKILSLTKEILYYKDKLNQGLPIEGRMDRVIYYNKCKERLAECEYALREGVKYHALDDRKRLLEKCRSDLRQAIFEVETVQASENRPFPFGFVLHGQPGVGKSALLTYMWRLWSSVKQREYDDSQVYNKILASEYDEGYFPPGQPYVHISELGNQHVNLASKLPDETLLSLSSWMDNIQFPVNRAFDDKGKVFACPEVVGIDTNEKRLNAEKQLAHPFAVWRRFHFIEVSVKKEFRQANSHMLDPRKALEAGGNAMDRYNLRVTRYVNDKDEEVLLETSDIAEFSSFMSETMRSFIDVQSKTKDVGVNQPIVSEAGEQISQDQSYREWFVAILAILIFGNPNGWFRGLKAYLIFLWELSVDCTFYCMYYHWSHTLVPGESLSLPRARIRLSKYSFFLIFLLFFSWGVGARFAGTIIFLICMTNIVDYKLILKQSVFDKWRVWLQQKRNKLYLRLEYLIGKTQLNPYVTPSYFEYLAYVPIILGFVYVCKKFLGAGSPIDSEATTDFTSSSVYSEKLNALESLVGSENLPKIIPNKVKPTVWNVVEPMIKVPTFTGDPGVLVKIAMTNLRRIRIKDNRKTTVYSLGVKSSYALCNTHMFADEKLPVIIEVLRNFNPDTVASEHILSPNDVVHLGNDLSIINLRGLMFKNISQHFCSGSFETTQAYFGKHSSVATFSGPIEMIDSITGKTLRVTQGLKYENPSHTAGDCGFPIICNFGSKFAITAIHMAGRRDGTDAYGTIIDSIQLENSLKDLESRQQFMPIMSEGGLPMELEPPGIKSVFRYEHLPHVRYLGKESGSIIMPSKSRLRRNRYKKLEEKIKKEFVFDNSDPFVKPMMLPAMVSGNYVSPINVNMQKVNRKKKPINPSLLRRCTTEYVEHIVSGLKLRGVESISPTTFEEAINGSFENYYFRRMNTSTAAGHGYSGKKRDHLPIVKYVDKGPIREPTEELKKDISSIIDSYMGGEASHPIFKMLFKDEPRLRSKSVAGKTRAFYSSPLPYLILAKMFLGPLLHLMTVHGEVFQTAIGINMYREAGNVISLLTKDTKSDRVSEGDYGEFDTSNPFDIKLASNTVLYEVLQLMGYNEDALTIVRGILTDSLFPVLNLLMDMFVVPGIQPSGEMGTTEKNSITLCLIFMMAFYSVPNNQRLKFFKEMGLSTNGDDSLYTKSSLVEKMTPDYMKQFSADVLGMMYTTSDKTDIVSGDMKFEEATFLKRNFKQVDGVWVATLDPKSIYRSICWTDPSDELPRVQQHIATFSSALYEIYLHTLDEAKFEEFRDVMCSELCDEFGKGNYKQFLPDFMSIEERINFRNVDYTGLDDSPEVIQA